MVTRDVKQRDAERTKAEILSEATGVFAESGYSGARVDEIARRCSTTKRMLYYYFRNKEGLYLAVLENAYRGIRRAEQDVDVSHLEPAEALRLLAELTYDHHREHSEFIRLVAIENIHHGAFIQQLPSLRELNKPALTVLDQVLSRGRAQGTFTSDVDALDVHLLISSYCVFQTANRHTFGYLFDVDLQHPARRDHLRTLIGDVVVSWLTSPMKGERPRPTQVLAD